MYNKTELTIGSYYDLSIKKIGNLSKNPFILFYVMMVRYQFSKSVITQLFFSEAEYREFVINNKILKDESNL
jgi:hypothetical protein